jgi:hypothetical protein
MRDSTLFSLGHQTIRDAPQNEASDQKQQSLTQMEDVFKKQANIFTTTNMLRRG